MSLRRPIWASQRFPGGSGLWRGGLWTSQRALDELSTLINDLFGEGQQGLLFVPQPVVLDEQRLYKLSDFTDPVTADGDPVGGGQEVSGNDNHLTQSVSADRPTYNTDGSLHWLGIDGTGQHLIFPNLSFSGGGTILVAVKSTNTSTQAFIGDNAMIVAFIASSSGDTSSAVDSGFGSVTYYRDGVELTGAVTRDRLYTEFCDGQWHILEAVCGDIPDPLQIPGRRGTNSPYLGDIGDVILIESVASADRESARDYLADRVGITL